jgi:hypothetical protein
MELFLAYALRNESLDNATEKTAFAYSKEDININVCDVLPVTFLTLY